MSWAGGVIGKGQGSWRLDRKAFGQWWGALKHLHPGAVLAEAKHPPGPPPSSWLGNIDALQIDPLTFLRKNADQYGDIFRYRIGVWNIVALRHPEQVKHVLQDHPRLFTKANLDYAILKWVLGEGLLTSEGEFWKRQRRMIQPIFHRERLGAMSEVMVGCALERVEHWKRTKTKTADIAEEMMSLTLQIVGKTLFSLDLLKEAKAIGEAFEYINDYLGSADPLAALLPPLPHPRRLRLQASIDTLDRVVLGIVEGRRRDTNLAHLSNAADAAHSAEASHLSNAADAAHSAEASRLSNAADAAHRTHRAGGGQDLVDLLLAARDEETGQGMSDLQIRDELVTMILAGHETTALALTWTFGLLSQHPEIERRVVAEIQGVLGGRPPTMADLPALAFSKQVLEESMRLYPPAWALTRVVSEDTQLGGYDLPARTVVVLSPYLTHHHPEIWPNPRGFEPERFSEAQSQGRHRFAYFPFGGGQRLCIGRAFALMEAHLLLVTLLQAYRVDLTASASLEMSPRITLRPKDGVPVHLTARA